MSRSSSKGLTRRDLLKLGVAAAAAWLLPEGLLEGQAAGGQRLGRVTWSRLRVRSAPSFQASVVGHVVRDQILRLEAEVLSPDREDFNRRWYRLSGDRYVYSGGVQQVQEVWQQPVEAVPEGGLLGEVSVPYTHAFWKTSSLQVAHRLYYGSLHYVTAVLREYGKTWYRLYDDRFHVSYFVDATAVRILSPEEWAPLSPEVPNELKWLEVDLGTQQVRAYEEDLCIWSARCATGTPLFATPTGWFYTFHKRFSLHMVGGDGASSLYDLPGVPWCTFITANGVAFHGTYWHDDFGAPASHGCVNLSIEDARWVFRWTRPPVSLAERMVYQPGRGTRVFIHD